MITYTFNPTKLYAKLKTLGAVIHTPMKTLVTEQARLIISSSGKVPGMIQVTPPFSQGTTQSKARKQGENKVRRDIRRVYGLPSDLYRLIRDRDPKLAKAFWGMVRNEKWATASALAERITGSRLREFDGGAAHRSRRSKGVVNGKSPSMFVRDPVGQSGPLEDYTDHRISHVGIYASGFNAAAARLSARGVPAWVTRHGTAFSGISIQETPTSFHITISDKVPFGQADTIRRMEYVLRYRTNALQRQMPHIIRNALKTAGFAAVTT